jgi:hypothetical protein
MGQTIWVDTEGRAKEDLPADNSIMLRLDKQLAALAATLRVAKLNDFFDHSVLAKEFGDNSVAESWFDAATPLATVNALREHLSAHPKALNFTPSRSQQHWPEALMKELIHCEEALRAAMEKGARVRLLIVP